MKIASLSASASGRRARARRDPELQALRALAVGLVVINHAQPERLPGGYIGVDVFFVLSGFLITSQLVREHGRTGRIAPVAFLVRRLRRLVPSLAIVLGTTAVVTWRVLPLDGATVATLARRAIQFRINGDFAAQQANYGDSPASSPLLHTWSLGVEAQFYLLALVLALASWVLLRRQTLIVVALSALCLASFAWSVRTTHVNFPEAFYLLPSRLWEFGVGAAVAGVLPQLPGRLAGKGAALIAAGLVLIGVGVHAAKPFSPYPGTLALLPTLAAAAVIVGAQLSGGERFRRPSHARLVQWIGDISYPLFLWHWPVLQLPLAAGIPRTTERSALLVLASLVLADLTHRLVEDPLRRVPLRLPVARTAGLVLLAWCVILVSAKIAYRPQVLDAGRPAPSASLMEPTSYVPSDLDPGLALVRLTLVGAAQPRCVVRLSDRVPSGCVSGDAKANRTVALFGDSHMLQWMPAIEDWATSRHWRVAEFIKPACPASDVRIFYIAFRREFSECDAFRRRALADLGRLRPQLVVTSNTRAYGDRVPPSPQYRGKWRAGYRRTLTAISRHARALVIADTPELAFDPVTCLSRKLRATRRCGQPLIQTLDPVYRADERDIALATGAAYTDLTTSICPSDFCAPILGKTLVWRDSNHLTPEFAAAIGPRLGAALDEAMGDS